MARLPIPGNDTDTWGELLNEFLRVAHHEDGTLHCVPLDALSHATDNRGGEIGYHHEATIQQVIAQIEGQKEALCLSEGTWHIQADLEIPENIILFIPRGAVLKLYPGVTITIYGRIEAGIYKIFDYADDTPKIIWSYRSGTTDTAPEHGSKQELYPEWWGAVASKTHDPQHEAANNAAFRRMFAMPTMGLHPLRARLQPGSVYRVSEPVRILAWFHVFGERSQLRSSVNTAGTAAVQIGSLVEGKKPFYMDWRGVDVFYAGSPQSAAIGILIDNSDFGVFHNCNIGGWDVGLKSGEGAVTEWTFRNINVSGCRIGYEMGEKPGDTSGWSPPNVSTWDGGKIQQCTELGMHLQNMSRFELRNLDLSLNGQGSIKLEKCGAFRVSVYTEAVGQTPSLPGTPNNNWKNIHLISCNGWTIENCALLGSLSPGSNGENNDPAYGIYVEGESKNGRITNNVMVRHRTAAIYIGPDCRNIFEANNEHQDNHDEQPGSITVIDESSEGNLIRLTGGIHEVIRRVPNRVVKLQNFIIAGHDFTDPSWVQSFGGANLVTVTEDKIVGPDGVTPAQVLDFYTSDPPTGMQTFSLPIPGLEGKTIILEWFHKITDMDPVPPGIGYPQIRVVMFRIGDTTGIPSEQGANDGLHRGGIPGTDWIFNRREWIVPAVSLPDERLRLVITNRPSNETYRIAIAGICLRVKGESACYYPKFERVGAIDRPGHGQALPGLQVLAYGGQAIRVFVAEDSPQMLGLLPPPGAGQWEVGDRCFNSVPTAGGVAGWICTSAGNPGVWKAYGAVEP